MAKTVLYYFTATGNSLAAAQELGSLLEDSLLVPIVSANGEKGVLEGNPENRPCDAGISSGASPYCGGFLC